MGEIVYEMHVSLDGYIADVDGGIGFSEPPPDVHQAANDATRDTATFLFGRRMYEAMEGPWRELAAQPDLPDVAAEFARLYFRTPRIVFSDTLTDVPDGVRLVRGPDALSTAAALKRDTDGVLSVGGAGLAASLIDLVDEFRCYVMPVALGGGTPYLPAGRRLDLRPVGHRLFESGVTLLRYRRRT